VGVAMVISDIGFPEDAMDPVAVGVVALPHAASRSNRPPKRAVRRYRFIRVYSFYL